MNDDLINDFKRELIISSFSIEDHERKLLEYFYNGLPQMMKKLTDIIATAIYRMGGNEIDTVFVSEKKKGEKLGKSIVNSFKLGNKIIDIVG